MKRTAFVLLMVILLVLTGCRSGVADQKAETSSKNADAAGSNATQAGEQASTSAPDAAPVEEKVYHCFYVKDDALYFTDTKRCTTPIKLTENLVTGDWQDVGSVRSLAGTLICRYDAGTGMAFYSDNGASNLYYRDTSDPNAAAVHIADGIAAAYTTFLPDKSVVYYVSNNLDLYEYDLSTGSQTVVAQQVTGVETSDQSDIVYTSDYGTYAKNAFEEAVLYDDGTAASGDGFDSSAVYREIKTYDSGERYYLSLDAATDELVLCYWNGASVSELYRHPKMNYHAEIFDDSPMIALTFPSIADDTQTYNGDIVIASRGDLSVLSSGGVDHHLRFNSSGTSLYYLEAVGPAEVRLMRCDIQDGVVGTPVVAADQVGKLQEGFCWNDDSGVYYVKIDANKYGYLYYNETQADPERLYGVVGIWNQQLLYKTGSAQAPYTLKASDHGTAVTIGSQVSANRRQKEALWMIENYNAGTETGDLTLVLNGKNTPIDQNVICIVA